MSRREKGLTFLRAFLTLLLLLTLIAVVGLSAYLLWEKPPEIAEEAPVIAVPERPFRTENEPIRENVTESERQDEQEGHPATDRTDGVYTLLLVGSDVSQANTDTILVARFNTNAHEVNVMSIPRDLYINNGWNIRKVNAVYSGTINSGGVGIDGLKKTLKSILGFDIDCYAVVNLNVFMQVIDLLGGVDFEVPCDMHYEDPNQSLYIHLNAGYQHLNGEQAMGVCRFRSGYVTGDAGRIETQQKFMRACVSQFITLGNIPNISKIVELLSENLDTNLSAANIAFFIRQGLACSAEDIHFETMPTVPMMAGGLWYCFADLNAWIDAVNTRLNPYETPIESYMLNLAYYIGEGVGIGGTQPIIDPDYIYRENTLG